MDFRFGGAVALAERATIFVGILDPVVHGFGFELLGQFECFDSGFECGSLSAQ